jgi:hypothetical protein
MSYAKDEEPEKHLADDTLANAFYPVLKNHIQRNEDYRCKRAENGKRGGGQFGNANATKNEQKRPKTSKNEQKRTPNPNPIPNPIPNPNYSPTGNIGKESVKERYGEFDNVLLTIDEFMKLTHKRFTLNELREKVHEVVGYKVDIDFYCGDDEAFCDYQAMFNIEGDTPLAGYYDIYFLHMRDNNMFNQDIYITEVSYEFN